MVQPIRHKSDVFESWKKFVQRCKTETGHRVKALRSDNGTEFINAAMKEFNDSKGIRHEKAPPYTPEANGRAEREVRTLVECARSMLIDSGLDEEMWAEAIVSAAYLLNRTTNKHQKLETPFEAWYNKKPEVKHLRIFGSTAFVQVPKVNRSKLEPKCTKIVMVGYDGESKVYRLWNAARREIVIANNVHICDGVMLQGTRELLQNDF